MSNELQHWEDNAERQRLKVKVERLAQLKKWGLQRHALPIWSAILSEEVGELSQEILRQTFNPKDKPTSTHNLAAEAIQVAAVALAIAQYVETGEA